MKFFYKKNPMQQFIMLLKFCTLMTLCELLVALGIFVFLVATLLTINSIFGYNFQPELLYIFCWLCLIFATPFSLKYASFRSYKTFKIDWHIEISKNTFYKKLYISVLLYTLISCGVSMDVCFPNARETLSFWEAISTDIIITIAVPHLFILNKWLPFSLKPIPRQNQQ